MTSRAALTSALESIKSLLRRCVNSIVFLAALGLVLGVILASVAIPQPNVALITISDFIDHNYTDDVLYALQHARSDNDIKAVVLRIDSPGGSASAVEEIYLEVLRIRQHKPVVASVGRIAASGGYYIAAAADFIYVQPTSQIGSIGVWSTLPRPEELHEDVLTSGPFKATGFSREKAVAHLEMVRQAFVQAVILQRGERLKLTDEELSAAEIYLGYEAVRHGLVDFIDSRTAAVEKAADMAGLRNYGLVEFDPVNRLILNLETLRSQPGVAPTYYYLYFEQE